MLGRKERDQLEFFVAGSLRDLLPDDHVLVRVDRVLDLSWLHPEVAGLYCSDSGRPGIDPEVAVRLMLAGLVLGIVQDRRLMREAQVNLAIRWFAGYGLHEALPDHSSLTRIRQRWGEALFRKVFTRIVQDCAQAGLITAETVHMDASLIRADVSMDALVDQHLEAVQDANDDQRQARTTAKYKKLCRSDPDATMATSSGCRASTFFAGADNQVGRFRPLRSVRLVCGFLLDVVAGGGFQVVAGGCRSRVNLG